MKIFFMFICSFLFLCGVFTQETDKEDKEDKKDFKQNSYDECFESAEFCFLLQPFIDFLPQKAVKDFVIKNKMDLFSQTTEIQNLLLQTKQSMEKDNFSLPFELFEGFSMEELKTFMFFYNSRFMKKFHEFEKRYESIDLSKYEKEMSEWMTKNKKPE